MHGKSKGIVYLSGPITANPDHIQEFAEATRALSELGYDCINPVELVKEKIPCGLSATETWKRAMEMDLRALRTADVVCLLERKDLPSRGMDIEIDLARSLGIPVIPLMDMKQKNPVYRKPGHKRS